MGLKYTHGEMLNFMDLTNTRRPLFVIRDLEPTTTTTNTHYHSKSLHKTGTCSIYTRHTAP